MRVVRHSVFETNSSSTHSISIATGQFTSEKWYAPDGVCTVYPGEFGWEVEDYYDNRTKASYCLTYVKMIDDENLLSLLREVLEEETGAAVVFEPSSSEWHPWGYIDHQSADVCADAFLNKDILRAFIFNPNSCLHTDNDNH